MSLIDLLQSELGATYRIDRELPGGGMSRVFVATELAYGRTVVIKLLRPDLAADMMAERFTREIQLVARLQQANIVPLIAAGQTSQGPYYTMPFVDGASLRQRLGERQGLDIPEVVGILKDVARALAYAHDAGVIHRDIKPENVLLSGGAAVVTDFGIAKAVTDSRFESATTTITQVGTGVGTPAYMAPEQAVGDPSVDHRADIYAFGCLAYELIAGHSPFHDRPMHQVVAAQISETPAPMSTQRAGVPAGLASLVERCLEKDASRRPQSARELLATLDSLSTPSGARAPASPRARPVAIGAAALLVVVAVGAYLASSRRSGATPDGDVSVAVIPFTNVGGDSAQDFLADGVSDELATAIGKVSGLHMTARSAAYRYRGRRDLDVRELGKTLSARFLVQGTLRRAGENLRISAQLSDASTGKELWSDAFERTTGDVFRTQNEITSAIVKALASRLQSPAVVPQPARAAATGTGDPVAYEHYLRGEFLIRRRNVDAAIDMYEAAIKRDTTFARAYAGLSQALELTPYYNDTSPDSVRGRAMAAANHALAIDGNLARAHTSLGLAYMHAWQWTEARAAFERAVAADPNDVETRVQFGRYLYFVGDAAGALEQLRRAQTIDPFHAVSAAWIGYISMNEGRPVDALAQTRRAFEYDSSAGAVKALGAQVFLRTGETTSARAIAVRVPPMPPMVGERAYVFGGLGDTAGVRAIERELDALPGRPGFRYTALAMAYLGMRDTARALQSLERATDAHEAWPAFHSVTDRMYDPLRHSARWAALLRRVGLESAPHALP